MTDVPSLPARWREIRDAHRRAPDTTEPADPADDAPDESAAGEGADGLHL